MIAYLPLVSPERYGVVLIKEEFTREIQYGSWMYMIVALFATCTFIEFLSTEAKVGSTFFTVGTEVVNPNHQQIVSLYHGNL